MAIEAVTKYTVVCDRCGDQASSTGDFSVEDAIEYAKKKQGYMFSSWQVGEVIKHSVFCYRCVELVLSHVAQREES